MAALSQPTIELRIAGREAGGTGVAIFDLRWPDNAPLPAFEAGAHVDVHLPTGHVRQYSLFNDPAERHRYCIAVRRDDAGRGGSVAMHDLAQGQRLRVGLPRAHFRLDSSAPHSILVGAGIGITPLVAMAHELARQGASFELHRRVRDTSDAPLSHIVAAAEWSRHARLHAGDRDSFDAGILFPALPPGTQLYICGPQGFMDSVAKASGLPASRIHTESFGKLEPVSGDRAFELVLARSGLNLTVPADRSILDVVAEHGIYLPTSCEQGICGTCRTAVLEGIPDHRDLVLSDAERQSGRFITPCCSRALGNRLVLDL